MVVMLAFLLASALPISAQSLTDPAPPIVFSDWKLDRQEVGAKRYVAAFPSPLPSGVPVNDTVTIMAFLPNNANGPVPAVIVLHYWGATDHRVEINSALELARRGIAGIVISLPYHVERTPEGHRSGDLAITPNVDKLTQTMRQSIFDIKRVVDWIQSRSEFRQDRIGIMGASLGSIVGALAVGTEPRLTDAAFVVGGADLAKILWQSSRVVVEREQFRRDGFTESKLRAALQAIEPLTYLPNHRPKRALVVGAKYDTVIPNVSTQELIQALDQPATIWLDTGHYGGFLIQKQVQRTVSAFFQAAFSDAPYTPPSSLNAPTVRLGATIDGEAGMQICAGIDLLRPNRLHDPFATFFVSPRGPQLALGATLDRGLSAGLLFRPKQIAFGIIWSVVL